MKSLWKLVARLAAVMAVALVVLVGVLAWSVARTSVLYGRQIETDAAFLAQRLCRQRSIATRRELCAGYVRRLGDAEVSCAESGEGSIGLTIVVDPNRFDNFDESLRPVSCKR